MVKPPLFVQTVFGILGGIGPHPEDVMHMKRTADRLFGDQYQLVGAGRRPQPAADRRGWRRRWAVTCASGWRIRCGSVPASWPNRSAQQVKAVRQIVEGLGLGIATPDEARQILSLKGADRVNF